MTEPTFYVSGANEPGELRGLAKAGQPAGVAAHQCRAACERELERDAHRYPHFRVFVDSGAFSEVSERPDGPPVVTAPISDAEWRKRLELMERIAAAYGRRALLIAPDQVGSQEATLERLKRYREYVDRLRRSGAEVAVVLQRGPDTQAKFDRKAKRALNWGGYVVAFPMKKAATTDAELVAFLRARRPRRVHLLGLGRQSPRRARVLEIFRRYSPKTVLSFDAAEIRAKVGRTGGRGGGPRPYTKAQDVAAEEIRSEALSGLEVEYGPPELPREVVDLTEEIGRPSDWIETVATRATSQGGMGYKSVAAWAQGEAGLTLEQAKAFERDPDGFLQTESPSGLAWWEYPTMDEALDRAWPKWVALRTVQLRRERGIEPVWGGRAIEDLPLFQKP